MIWKIGLIKTILKLCHGKILSTQNPNQLNKKLWEDV